MIYEWKRNVYQVDAQEAGEFLSNLQERAGYVTPSLIVDSSRTEESPLHNYFEWDDSIAGEQYRRVQAGTILRTIVLVKASGVEEEEPIRVRAFMNIQEEDDEGDVRSMFMSVGRVMENDSYRNYVLEQALRELGSFRRKYAQLKELDDVFSVIDDALSVEVG